MATMTLIALILFLNPIFASGISFTAEQCQRFKAEGITGGDYYINEALARDCKIQVPEGNGYFPPMVLNPNETQKKNCGMKNLALDGNNSGYFQDVVTFNNMHPDYFYPDRGDEYPFVFAIQVPGMNGETNVGNAVGVDVDSVPGCRKKIESLLGSPLKDNKVIMTAGHLFISNKGGQCEFANQTKLNNTYMATGKDVSSYDFLTKASNVVCVTPDCDKIESDVYNDFCIIVTEDKLKDAAIYSSRSLDEKKQSTKFVAYQPLLVRHSNRSDIRSSERMISISREGIKTQESSDIIHHFSDASAGGSGGALLDSNNYIFGLHISEIKSKNSTKIQKGYKGSSRSNNAVDIKKACQRLSTVLN